MHFATIIIQPFFQFRFVDKGTSPQTNKPRKKKFNFGISVYENNKATFLAYLESKEAKKAPSHRPKRVKLFDMLSAPCFC